MVLNVLENIPSFFRFVEFYLERPQKYLKLFSLLKCWSIRIAHNVWCIRMQLFWSSFTCFGAVRGFICAASDSEEPLNYI